MESMWVMARSPEVFCLGCQCSKGSFAFAAPSNSSIHPSWAHYQGASSSAALLCYSSPFRVISTRLQLFLSTPQPTQLSVQAQEQEHLSESGAAGWEAALRVAWQAFRVTCFPLGDSRTLSNLLQSCFSQALKTERNSFLFLPTNHRPTWQCSCLCITALFLPFQMEDASS